MENLKTEILEKIQKAGTLKDLEEVRVHALGKQSKIAELMKSLGGMSPEEKKEKGQTYNNLRQELTAALDEKKTLLEVKALDAKLATEKIDVTLPSRPFNTGKIHPLTQTWYDVVQIFGKMGFTVAEGPEIEDDFHNFTALNVPPEHPARQEQDTFYLPDSPDGRKMVLRTQTSSVQIRTMNNAKPPIRIIAPGRTYRSDSDATHTPTFHQIEGLMIDKHINMAHLKGCLAEFCSEYFGVENIPVRFRPAFFPFTEPSAEMEIGCQRSAGEITIGAGNDWLEILGCGMVHPNVLKTCNIDPEEYQGFAFGMGLERITMLKYGLPDLRAFYECDIRWIKHHGFSLFNSICGDNL